MKPNIKQFAAIISIFFSILSLVITLIYYNRQAERPAAKFFGSLCGTVTSIFFRVFIVSILFANIPEPTFGIVAVLYLVNLIAFAVHEGTFKRLEIFLNSYCSTLSPFGYARPMVSNGLYKHQVSMINVVVITCSKRRLYLDGNQQ